MTESQDNAPYLAIGAIIYAGVSALWVLIVYFTSSTPAAVFVTAVLLIILLVAGAIITLRRAVAIRPISSGSAELGKWFGIIFTAEGVGIGVGSGVLVALGLEAWIAPWTALLVGLHFLPLGRLLKLPMDYVLGAAIILLVVVTVLAVSMDSWAVLLGLGTALLLWLAGWGRLYTAHKVIGEMQAG